MDNRVFEIRMMSTEKERAANAYLMSLVGLMAGLPLPIINLIATAGYFLKFRKSTAFVRFHAFQAMISQVLVVIANSITLSMVIDILWGSGQVSQGFFAWLAVAIFINVFEIIGNIAGAIYAGKGRVYSMFFFGTLAMIIYGKHLNEQYETLLHGKEAVV